MKKKKGFTLIEIVVTLSIIGIAFALTSGVVAAILNIENKSATQLEVNKEFQQADELINEYVSYVSLKTDDVTFTFSYANTHEVGFTYSGSTYKLGFSNNVLAISNTYSGSNDYFKKAKSVNLGNIDDIKFEYTSSISLLKATMSSNAYQLNYTYVVRTGL